MKLSSSSNKNAYFSPDSFNDDNNDRGFLTSSPKSDMSAGSLMLDVKLTRKRAESDLQLLANRIALLKIEEQKAQQKVLETKARANEILEYVFLLYIINNSIL